MLFTQVTILALAALAATRPIHDEEHLQVLEARAAGANTKRTLESCASQLEAQGVLARAMERRKGIFDAHRTVNENPLDSGLYFQSFQQSLEYIADKFQFC